MVKNANSPLMAVLMLLVFVGAYLWVGWPGLVIALAAELIGGLGVIVNARRRGYLRA